MAISTYGELTVERVRELLHYDPETGIFTRKIDTGPRGKAGEVVGTRGTWGYLYGGLNGKRYSMHRVAWFYVYGEWPPEDIDHINRVRNDNRIANLRCVSRSENLRNTKIRRDNASGVKGLWWDAKRSKWQAYIRVHGKQIHLGRYENKKAAELARALAEARYGFVGAM